MNHLKYTPMKVDYTDDLHVKIWIFQNDDDSMMLCANLILEKKAQTYLASVYMSQPYNLLRPFFKGCVRREFDLKQL